jgi:hypothetical protein
MPLDKELLTSLGLGGVVGLSIGAALSKEDEPSTNLLWFALAGAASGALFKLGRPKASRALFLTGAGEMSFEEAWAHAEQHYTPGASHVPDLTAEQLGRPFAGGTFLDACGTPSDMQVTIKAAVQNGRAVGVTVTTSPPSARISSCIAAAVRRLQWPVNPNMDAVTQTF